MVQAARSGKQNIVEGSVASATSKKTETKLVNVAMASLQELLVDYEDFLRTRNPPSMWISNKFSISHLILLPKIGNFEIVFKKYKNGKKYIHIIRHTL